MGGHNTVSFVLVTREENQTHLLKLYDDLSLIKMKLLYTKLLISLILKLIYVAVI